MASRKSARASSGSALHEALALLERSGSKSTRDGMARFGIIAPRAFGVPVGTIQRIAKSIGRDHELALALWDSGWYEARMLAAYVDDPAVVTPAQMDRWAKDFDNWAICDTVCFALFDRTPHAWTKVTAWSRKRDEYVRRAAFALLWGLSVHDRKVGDAGFINGLTLVEQAATDERLYVKKAVNMALRAIGKRNAALNKAAMTTANRLAASTDATARWIGKDALRELSSPAVKRRLAAKGSVSSRGA